MLEKGIEHKALGGEDGFFSIFAQAFSKNLSGGWRSQRATQATSLNPGSIQYPAVLKPILITFDDGYEGVYRYAYPILREHGFTAIIFVTTGYVGKHNNWDASPGPRFRHLDWTHIKEMAEDGIWFGSHGVNHPFLTRQSDSEARYEIEASKKNLEDRLGRQIHFFSYPYGNYNNRIMNLVQESGYSAAFSLRPEFLKIACIEDLTRPWVGKLRFAEEKGQHPLSGWESRGLRSKGRQVIYALPRIAIYLLDSTWAFKAKVGHVCDGSGCRSRGLPKEKGDILFLGGKVGVCEAKGDILFLGGKVGVCEAKGDNGSLRLPLYVQRLKNRLINRCAYASMLVESLKS